MVKNCVVTIDATPFAEWYAGHYGVSIGTFPIIKVKRTKKLKFRVESPKEP